MKEIKFKYKQSKDPNNKHYYTVRKYLLPILNNATKNPNWFDKNDIGKSYYINDEELNRIQNSVNKYNKSLQAKQFNKKFKDLINE